MMKGGTNRSKNVLRGKAEGSTRPGERPSTAATRGRHRDASAGGVRLVFPKDTFALLVLIVVATVLFSNGFSKELVFDDLLAIDRNKDSATDKGVSLREIFFHDFWGHGLDEVSSNGSYRPLVIVTFRIQYLLAGLQHNVAFLQLFNYVFACANAVLVYYVARLYDQLLRGAYSSSVADNKSSTEGGVAACHDPYGVPMLSALLFLVHPAHVDAVTSIVGRCEILYCTYGLVAFFAVHAFAAAPMSRRSTLTRRAALLTLAFFSLCCCVLCKDSGVTFAALISLHTALLYSWRQTSRLRLAVVVVLAVGFTASYLSFRHSFIGVVDLSKSKLLRRSETPQYFIPEGVWHWLSMRWTIQIKNFELLFYPTQLCCEYSYDCIPHMGSLSDARLPYYLAVSGGILSAVVYLSWKALRQRCQAAVLALVFLFWIALPYAPVSHLFVQTGTFIAERCLYVPSIGVVLIYSFVLRPSLPPNLSSLSRSRNWGVWAAIALLGVWFALSHRRNTAWTTNETLFRAAVDVCPRSGKAHAQLGIALAVNANAVTPAAVEQFGKAIQLDKEETDALYYLAIDAWEVGKDAKSAYEMVRRCVSNPFSASRCYELYTKMRDALFPQMTKEEQLLDEATVLPLLSQRAIRLRQVGLMRKGRGDGMCAAVAPLATAMQRWNDSSVFWFSDEANPNYGDATFCNTAFHWAEAFEACHLQPDRLASEKTVETVEEDGSRYPVLRPRRLHGAMRDLRLAATRCSTVWDAPGVVRGARSRQLHTYGNRLQQYQSLNRRLKATLASMKPFLLRAEDRRLARLTALQLVVGGYCDAVTLTSNTDVRATLARLYPREVEALEIVAAEHLGKWRIEIASLWREHEQMRADIATDQAVLDEVALEIRAASRCSTSLSSIFAYSP